MKKGKKGGLIFRLGGLSPPPNCDLSQGFKLFQKDIQSYLGTKISADVVQFDKAPSILVYVQITTGRHILVQLGK